MWLLIALVMIALVGGWIFLRRTGGKGIPAVRYVCDLCGERDCICHKEETKDQEAGE